MPRLRRNRITICTVFAAAVAEAQHIDALARSLPALAVGRISAPVSVEIPDRTAPRLAAIPGVGPIAASLIAAAIANIGLFKSARQFAASSFDISIDWNPPEPHLCLCGAMLPSVTLRLDWCDGYVVQ
jgi:hypothetical protein